MGRLAREWRADMSRSTWGSGRRQVEDTLEEDAGTVIGQDSVANLFIIEDRRLDLQLGADEGELHEGEFVSTLQVLGLNLNIRLVDPEGFAGLDVGDEKSELAVKVEKEDPEPLGDHDPMLSEGPENTGNHQKWKISIVRTQGSKLISY